MLKEIFESELKHESEVTRVFLSRIPTEKLDWKPDEKSMSLGHLATHLANLPWWGQVTLTETCFDLTSPEAEVFTKNLPNTPDGILNLYDKNIALLQDALSKMTDDDFNVNWTLKMGEKEFFTQPRIGVLRGFFFNHLIHHRAQLGVYFRLNGIPVPSSYGPSADEQM